MNESRYSKVIKGNKQTMTTSSSSDDDDDHVIEPLNEMESSPVLGQEPGITTITFFEGEGVNPTNNKAVEYLKERTNRILQSNPWAAGKIIRNSNHKNLQLIYPKEITNELLDRIFVVVDDDGNSNNDLTSIHSDMPYDDMTRVIGNSSAMIPSGSSCINKDVLVTRITLVVTKKKQSNNNNRFALIVSMSHTCSDGYTYYRILSMLSNDGTISSLNAKRKPINATEVAWNSNDWKFVTSNIGFIANMIFHMIFGRKAQAYAYYVDDDKIEIAKKQEKDNAVVDFVSTNDILVSNQSNLVHPRIQTMAVNFRNRIEGALESDAGNYEAVLFLDEGSYKTPTCIRKALTKYINDPTTTGRTQPLPGLFWESFTFTFSQLSNWAFKCFDELEIPDTKQELHIPIINISKIPFDCAVMFRAKPGRTAIMYICKTPEFMDPTIWQTKAPVGESLSKEIFGS